MKKIQCVGLVCAMTAMGSVASAHEMVTMLPEMVVTATRTVNAREKVPTAMEVITAEDIKRSGAYDLRSLIAHETGVQVQDAERAGGYEAMIRGVDSDKTLIMVDGRRLLNEADAKGLGNRKALSRINMNEVERIEIVKGPSSALYGSDAIGGVIHIITKKAKEPSISLGAQRTLHDGETWVHWDTGKKGRVSATADVRFDKTYRYIPAGEKRSNGYGAGQSYDVSVNYDFDENHYVHAYYNYYSQHLDGDQPGKKRSDSAGGHGMGGHGKSGQGMRGHGGMSGAGAVMTEAERKSKEERRKIGMWMRSEGMAQKDYENDYKKKAYGVDYNSQNEKGHWQVRAYGGTFDWSDTYVRNGRLEDVNVNRNEIRAFDGHGTLALNENHRITVGGEYTYNFVKGTNLDQKGNKVTFYQKLMAASKDGDVERKKYISEKDVTTKAVYIQDEMTFGKWFIVPALRYDHHSTFGSHVSPKLGVTYSANKDVRVKLNYGDGFKAPNIPQLYYGMGRQMGPYFITVLGNPDLKPETSRNGDISMEIQKGPWQNTLSYYHNEVDNLIHSVVVKKNDTYRFMNVKKARIQGVEHTVSYRPAPAWEFRLMTNWMQARDVTKREDLPNRPEWMQKFQMIYNNEDAGFHAMLWVDNVRGYAYTEEKDGPIFKDGYRTWNFTMSKEIYDGTTVFGTVENIFDVVNDHCKVTGRFLALGFDHRF